MKKPFYFVAIFWGAVHRGYFVRFLLASMLADRNLPALGRERANRFLIVTTPGDWADLQSEPLFETLKAYCEPVWLELCDPSLVDSKMKLQSIGHRLASERCFEDRAFGVFLTPDIILSNGSLLHLETLADAGTKVVFSVAIRFSQDPIEDELTKAGIMAPGQPLALESRALMHVGLANLHTETLRYDFNSTAFAYSPISVYWPLANDEGIVIYSFSWCPVLVDYGALHNHDTQTFDEWTLDGDYIYRNFPSANDVRIITDSDDFGLISLTREADMTFDLSPERPLTWPIVGRMEKMWRIFALWESTVMDPLKRDIFVTPVVLHSRDVSLVSRLKVARTQRTIRRSVGGVRRMNVVGFWMRVYRPVQHGVRLAIWQMKRVRWLIVNHRFVQARVLWRLGLRAEKPLLTDPKWNIVDD